MEKTCCEAAVPGIGWWRLGAGIKDPKTIPYQIVEQDESAECDCAKPTYPNCWVTFYRKLKKKPGSRSRGKEVLEQTRRRPGRCVWCGEVIPGWPEYPDGPGIILTDGKPGELPEDCFWWHYNAYTTPDQDHWLIGYEKACDLANRRCKTHHVCNPCGVGPQGRPPYLSGLCLGWNRWRGIPYPTFDPLISDAELLRGAGCGPHGADKLAHCWLVCKVYTCYGPGGGAPAAIAAYIMDRLQKDPDDQLADAMGLECGNSLSLRPPWKPPAQSWTYECLDCCRKKTYDLLYRE